MARPVLDPLPAARDLDRHLAARQAWAQAVAYLLEFQGVDFPVRPAALVRRELEDLVVLARRV